jgi:hypothetical protein
MAAAAAIAPVRAGSGVVFGTHEMLASRATMAGAAEYADLVNKVGFFQCLMLVK